MSSDTRHLLSAVLLLGGVFTSCPMAHGGELDLPIEVLAIRENAERLRSGEYSARGTITMEPTAFRDYRKEKPDFKPDPEGLREFIRQEETHSKGAAKSENWRDATNSSANSSATTSEVYEEFIASAFDFDTGHLAFRRTRTQRGGQFSTHGRARQAWFVGLPDRTILVRGGVHPDLEVTIEGSVSSPSEVSPFFQPVFDARSMGWGGVENLRFHYGAEFLSNTDPDTVRITDEGNGIRRIDRHTTVGGDPESRPIVSTWWCDERQGYQPVRFVQRSQYLDPKTPAQEAYNQTSNPRAESEFSWSNVNGVWVLAALDIVSRGADRIEHWQLTFDWKSVNNPVSSNHFDWQSWELPMGSQVLDLRMGTDKPVLVKWVGMEMDAALPATHNAESSRRAAWLFLVLTILLFSVLAGWYAKQKLRKGPSVGN